jgi:long-subunit acyl-CoA synthetase (AMP-forming)
VDIKSFDDIVLNKIKAMLGGKVNCMLTASAPIDPAVLDFLKVCF